MDIVEEEFQQFLADIKNGYFALGAYLDESDYEDEDSHNDIDDMQNEFMERVKEYLHEHHPRKYFISSGWCVHVMTVERAKESKINNRHIELHTIN